MSTESAILVGFSRAQEQRHLGNLIVSTSTPICKVINVKSNMPILTIGFNLFLLLILSFSTLITACILVKKNRRPASNKKNANNKKPKSKDPVMMKDLVGLRVSFSTKSEIAENPLSRPKAIKIDLNSLSNLIIYITLFSALLNMPSLITRNIYMFSVNIQHEEPGSESDWSSWQAQILNLCDKLDYLLLFSSSHKFFIFIFKCNLIRIPTERFCRIRCNFL